MTEANAPVAERTPSADPARQSPGEYLRRLREESGHTHATVGTALHLTVHYIKALEGDEYGKLPGLTFVKGYLRAYARFLGADVDSVISRFDEHIAGLMDAGQHTARVERSKRRQDQALRWGIGAGCVVVTGLLAGWWFMSGRETQAESVQRAAPGLQVAPASPPSASTATTTARTSTPVVNMPAFTAHAPALQPVTTSAASAPMTVIPTTITAMLPKLAGDPVATAPVAVPPQYPQDRAAALATTGPANAAESGVPTITLGASGGRQVALIGAGTDELTVAFIGNSWIEVDDGSLVRLYNAMLSAGDTLTIRGKAPFHVLLGDASQVRLSLNATTVDISSDIRDDSTARLVVGAPATIEVTP